MDEGQRHSKFINSHMKNNIAQFLLKNSHEGVLTKNAITEASSHVKISRKTTARIWKAATEQMVRGEPVQMVGKKRGYHHEDKLKIDEEKVRSLSVLERSSIRKMAGKLEVSKSTIGEWVKQKEFKPHTNAIKPVLTERNKIARLRWCLSQMQQKISEGKVPHHTIHNVVHIDGKLGIFPFTEMLPAKRNLKNRTKGTMEIKPTQSITKAVTKDFIIQKIIPSIKVKWPFGKSKEVYTQQDNAKPHISPSDEDFRAVANLDRFKIHLIYQQPNSPDSNILDLGFFRAIQSIQDKKPCKNVDELVANVITSFEELSSQTLNKAFLTLQNCLTEILKVKGGNNYKIPRMKKDRLERIGLLPTFLEVEEGLLREVVEYLGLPQNKDVQCYDISPLPQTLGY